MEGAHFLLVYALLALASSIAFASDPGPLQDFCAATNDPSTGVLLNGRLCKDPKLTTVNDFTFSGLNIRADTSNQFGFNITFAIIDEFPGVNTLGISTARIDFAANGGLNPLHLHPRASEALVCMEGTLYAGFVTALPEYRLFAKILRPGDAFVFPQGLIHFQLNVGKTDAVAFASFNSQNPGVIRVAESTFGANPPIASKVLAKSFQLDRDTVHQLQNKFGGNQDIDLEMIVANLFDEL
ncbi:hypothetical protein Tsubulata_016994 [Turnera subulata]|uniref:Germin-like protein n=1 Tax=Turnera subulata TaxID=218843 RepID=A0A9Q0G638_9ROSI|nr:hypothetical protein Tsubulata_016994 [Turnera subulata]